VRHNLLATIAIIACILCVPCVASDIQKIIVAHGDNLVYIANDSPLMPYYNPSTNQFETSQLREQPGRFWLFGRSDSIYGRDFTTTGADYRIFIKKKDIWNLEPGEYDFVVQFPGQNQIYDVEYNSMGELGCIYKTVKNVSLKGISPRVSANYFASMMLSGRTLIDDIILQKQIVVEEPVLIVTNKYEDGYGNLHVSGRTNLAVGDEITGMIDEEKYQHADYKKMMSNTTFATGEDPSVYRDFEFVFPHNLATDELPPGAHFITVRGIDQVVATIRFDVGIKFIEPTQTPVVQKYYSVEGGLMGYRYNQSGCVTEVAAVLTPYPTYAPVKFGNRTIAQRDTVYVGEKNLNLLPAAGWPDENVDYKYRFRYEGDNENNTLDLDMPTHVDIDEARFWNKIGAWYQYSSSSPDKVPIVAFYVERAPVNAVTVPPTTQTIVETTVVTTTPVTTEPTTVIPTYVETSSPYPPGAMVVPASPVIALCAMAVAVLLKRS
jgi:hypothetical protein